MGSIHGKPVLAGGLDVVCVVVVCVLVGELELELEPVVDEVCPSVLGPFPAVLALQPIKVVDARKAQRLATLKFAMVIYRAIAPISGTLNHCNVSSASEAAGRVEITV
jgi:hypothetical protein